VMSEMIERAAIAIRNAKSQIGLSGKLDATKKIISGRIMERDPKFAAK